MDPRTGDPRLAINLPDWHESVLGALRGVLNRPVIIENDVNLAALAERSVGAARGLEDFVLVWIGGGLGMAAFLGGKVHRGAAGAAGEIGYLPVPGAPLQEDVRLPANGGLQSLVGASVVRMLAGVFGFAAPTAEEAVCAAVRAAADHGAAASGNGAAAAGTAARAQEFLGELARRVAIGVASVSVVLDPGLVVLGGDIGLAGGPALADRVAAEVARICPASPRVVPTGVTGAPVLRGAMLAAVDQARTDLLDSVRRPLPPVPPVPASRPSRPSRRPARPPSRRPARPARPGVPPGPPVPASRPGPPVPASRPGPPVPASRPARPSRRPAPARCMRRHLCIHPGRGRGASAYN